MDFDPDRALRSPFAIGALGALAHVLRFMPGASWVERMVNLIVGTLCAGFVAPAAAEWLNINSEGMRNAAAFLVGLLGVSLLTAMLDWTKSGKLGDLLDSWLPKRKE